MEAEPQVLDLTWWDLQKVSHAYRTKGIINEVEMPLAPAYDWVDVLVGYDDFMDAVPFTDALSHMNGPAAEGVAPIAAPIPYDYFIRHKSFLRDRNQSLDVIIVSGFTRPAAFSNPAPD
jgi:hypothetical protein